MDVDVLGLLELPWEAWPPSQPRTGHPTVDVDALIRVLSRIEGDANRRGWDRTPATLYVLYDRREADTDQVLRAVVPDRLGPGVVVGDYAARVLMPRSVLNNSQMRVPQALRHWAASIAYGPGTTDEALQAAERHGVGEREARQVAAGLNMIRTIIRLPGVIGFALLFEAWARQGSDEELAADDAVFRDFSTLPDSIEERLVRCVDVSGGCRTVTRSRGDKPVTVATEDGPRTMLSAGTEDVQAQAEELTGGPITGSLRMLVDTITGSVPTDQEGFDARYPSATRAMREHRAAQAAGG